MSNKREAFLNAISHIWGSKLTDLHGCMGVICGGETRVETDASSDTIDPKGGREKLTSGSSIITSHELVGEVRWEVYYLPEEGKAHVDIGLIGKHASDTRFASRRYMDPEALKVDMENLVNGTHSVYETAYHSPVEEEVKSIKLFKSPIPEKKKVA